MRQSCSKTSSSSFPTSRKPWPSATGATWSARLSTSTWLPSADGPTSGASPTPGHADLASLDEVYGLIADSIAKVNADLAQEPTLAKSQIHRFLILHSELSADDGVLTRTGKLRRGVIAERYRTLVDAMYGGRADVRVDIDGGHAGAASIDMKIRDAKVVAHAQIRSAA